MFGANTSATSPSTPQTMKLLIDTVAQRVLFAEAGKDVVDFIFGLLAMPLGAVDRLLAEDGSLGSIANVYASVEKMDAAYMQSTAARDTLLFDPAPANTSTAALRHLYRCDSCKYSRLRGFVQGVATYTVMDDDLTVTPTSGVSSVAQLKKLGVKDIDALEERTVKIGHEEVLGILKAALSSKTVLTDAFLTNKRKKRARLSGDKDDAGSTSE